MSTIFAQASAQGKAAVAVFRISGPNARTLLERLTQRPAPAPGACKVRTLYNFHSSPPEPIDKALVVFFPGPGSFTGEDVAEVQPHGSIAVASALCSTLLSSKLARVAEPGEFIKRAFLSGKLGLSQVEGLADLINAETKMQLMQANRQAGGELEQVYAAWRGKLIEALRLLEGYLDFSDEGLPQAALLKYSEHLVDLQREISLHLQDQRRGERLRNGLSLGIFGPPNAGKSSLINILTRRDIAIVHGLAGTTRDVIESHVDIGGYPIIISDTAGIREEATTDVIELAGIQKAIGLFSRCDIKLVLLDGSEDWQEAPQQLAALADESTMLVVNKSDILSPKMAQLSSAAYISCRTKDGIQNLLEAIVAKAKLLAAPPQVPAPIRHAYSVAEALQHIEKALTLSGAELISEELKLAARALASLIGEISTDEVLGKVFSSFCIGK